jgi:hypothetical protein
VPTNCESYDQFLPDALENGGDGQRLAEDFPRAELVTVPGAQTWVPVDAPAAPAGAIAEFVPAPVRS